MDLIHWTRPSLNYFSWEEICYDKQDVFFKLSINWNWCYLNQFPVDFNDILGFRIFDSNTMTSVQARRPPTCSRCRNHGIYGVQLKGHRNVCKYKLCNCRNCRLIVERRLVHDVVRPSQPTPTGPRRKSTRKEHAPRKLETTEDRRNTREETSNKATSINCLPTFSHGNGKRLNSFLFFLRTLYR